MVCRFVLIGISGGPCSKDVVPYDAESFGEDAGGIEVWLMLDEIVAPLLGESTVVELLPAELGLCLKYRMEDRGVHVDGVCSWFG